MSCGRTVTERASSGRLLSGSGRPNSSTRPAVARPAFFDLAYFMRLQSLEGAFDNDGFRRRIVDVAVIMDGFLDDLFMREPDEPH